MLDTVLKKRTTLLARENIGEVSWNVPLTRYSYWSIGGAADMLVEPQTIPQVQVLFKKIYDLNLPHIVIGDGSNLLFDDSGVRGVVIKIGRQLSRYRIDGTKIVSEAGIYVPRLVRNIGRSGLSGLEHAIGIPGTLGGLILMNGGSLRQGIGQNVENVWAVSASGEIEKWSHAQCNFGYRSSALQGSSKVVVKVELRCDPGNSKTIRRRMIEIMASRRKKFPTRLPSCGSVFLSTDQMYRTVGPPGKIIEEAGLKGLKIGDAQVSPWHANFIVNTGRATSRDVLQLIQEVRCTVHKNTDFWLECEAHYVYPSGRLIPAHLFED